MATYYVDGVDGNDANAGTSEGSGNAWATIDKAMNTVTGGDKVWVKGNGDYAELVTIDTAGSVSSPIVFEGYTTTTGDGGTATINGSATRANCLATSLGANTNTHYCFKNMRFTNATGDGVLLDNCRHVTYKGCRFDNNGGDGIEADNTAHHFERCTADTNGAAGFNVGISGGFFFCKSFSNTGSGFEGNGCVYFCCLGYANGSHGIDDTSTAGNIFIINCTFDGDGTTGSGVSMANNHRGHVIVNSIFDNFDGINAEGIDAGSADLGEVAISSYNCLSNNTSNYRNAATFTGEQTTNPGFTNQASDDYTLDGTGSADNAGADVSVT